MENNYSYSLSEMLSYRTKSTCIQDRLEAFADKNPAIAQSLLTYPTEQPSHFFNMDDIEKYKSKGKSNGRPKKHKNKRNTNKKSKFGFSRKNDDKVKTWMENHKNKPENEVKDRFARPSQDVRRMNRKKKTQPSARGRGDRREFDTRGRNARSRIKQDSLIRKSRNFADITKKTKHPKHVNSSVNQAKQNVKKANNKTEETEVDWKIQAPKIDDQKVEGNFEPSENLYQNLPFEDFNALSISNFQDHQDGLSPRKSNRREIPMMHLPFQVREQTTQQFMRHSSDARDASKKSIANFQDLQDGYNPRRSSRREIPMMHLPFQERELREQPTQPFMRMSSNTRDSEYRLF